MNVLSDQVSLVKEIIEPVNRYFHNPIAASIVQALKDTWVTPNQVTYASVFVGVVSAYTFSLGTLQAFFFCRHFARSGIDFRLCGWPVSTSQEMF